MLYKEEYATANTGRYEKIKMFCHANKIDYETEYRPTYCKCNVIRFTLNDYQMQLYNKYINDHRLF